MQKKLETFRIKAEKVSQWLRAHIALPEDLSSDPRTHVGQLLTACNSSSIGSNTLSGLYSTCTVHTPTYRHIIKHKREYFFKKYANLYEYSKFLTIEKENTRFSFLKAKNILVKVFGREGKVSCFPPIYMQVHMHVSPCVESRGQNLVSSLFNFFFFLDKTSANLMLSNWTEWMVRTRLPISAPPLPFSAGVRHIKYHTQHFSHGR